MLHGSSLEAVIKLWNKLPEAAGQATFNKLREILKSENWQEVDADMSGAIRVL
jgi:hypothetical protein